MPAPHAPALPTDRPRAYPRRRLASLRVIVAMILREMATTYGRSPGGYLWAVLEPAAGIALLTLVFSIGFRDPALGINFPMFYATGMIPFVMYNDISGKTALALMFSKPLMAYPAVTYVDAIAGRFLTNLLTQLLVAYITFAGIMLLFETRVIPDYLTIALGFSLTALLALGIGTLNCFLFTMIPVWQRAWSILMRPMFLVSCIFFLFETIPQPYRDMLWYNPLVHLVGLMRRGFYPSYDAPYVSVTYVCSVALIALLTGLVFLRRYHRDLLDQ